MTRPTDYRTIRRESLAKLGIVLRSFRQGMILDGKPAPQEYVAWWGGLDRGVVGSTERGQRDLIYRTFRPLLAAYNVTWTMFGTAMDQVDPIDIMPIEARSKRRAYRTSAWTGIGEPLLRPFAKVFHARRGELGQTQETMSLVGGLDRTFIGAVERAERSVTFVKLRQMLPAFRMTWRTFGQAMDRVDPIERYHHLPPWSGAHAMLRGTSTPPYGPALDREQNAGGAQRQKTR